MASHSSRTSVAQALPAAKGETNKDEGARPRMEDSVFGWVLPSRVNITKLLEREEEVEETWRRGMGSLTGSVSPKPRNPHYFRSSKTEECIRQFQCQNIVQWALSGVMTVSAIGALAFSGFREKVSTFRTAPRENPINEVFMGEFPEKDWTVFRRQALGRPDTTDRRDLGLFLR